MSTLPHLVLLSLTGFAVALDKNTPCYYPNGDEFVNSDGGAVYPCTQFELDGQATCCWNSDLCTSSGFCMSTSNGLFYRGLCTKRDWDTRACEKVCFQDEWSGQTAVVIGCNSTSFGCGFGSDASSICSSANSSERFDIMARSSITKYQLLPGRPGQPENVTFYTVDDEPSSTSVAPSDTSSGASSSGATSSGASSATSEATSSTVTSAGDGAKHDKPTEIGLGVGLGIPLLIALAGNVIMGSMLWRRRKSQTPWGPGAPTTQVNVGNWNQDSWQRSELAAAHGTSELPNNR